ncbi:MAG TPA: response regulator transcription factor [Arcobacter sp.]|nr:response regulator transcription factor [Arcobacter sp.]
MSRNDLILLQKRVLFLQPKTSKMVQLKEYLEKNNYELIHWNQPNPYRFKEDLLKVNANFILVDIAIFKDLMYRNRVLEAIKCYSSIGHVIFLTHEVDCSILVAAKSCKATAYLLKPSKEYEVLISLELAGVRKENSSSPEYNLAHGYTYNCDKKILFRTGKEICLSKNGHALLSLLVANRGCTVSFEQLIYHIWNHDHSLSSLRSLVYRINLQVHAPIIDNVKGIGYRIKQ